jgi:hypothetical protein
VRHIICCLFCLVYGGPKNNSQETGGGLNDQLFSSYSNLNLTTAPLIDRAPTLEDALLRLQKEKFDLIILMLRIGGGSTFQFINEANKLAPSIPVLLLVSPPPPSPRTTTDETKSTKAQAQGNITRDITKHDKRRQGKAK